VLKLVGPAGLRLTAILFLLFMPNTQRRPVFTGDTIPLIGERREPRPLKALCRRPYLGRLLQVTLQLDLVLGLLGDFPALTLEALSNSSLPPSPSPIALAAPVRVSAED
jgi:hypothetical protein